MVGNRSPLKAFVIGNKQNHMLNRVFYLLHLRELTNYYYFRVKFNYSYECHNAYGFPEQTDRIVAPALDVILFVPKFDIKQN